MRDLRACDNESRGVRETDHNGCRKQIDQHAETKKAESEPDNADHECESDGVGQEQRAAWGCKCLHRGATYEGRRRHRAGGELAGRAEKCRDNRGQEGGVQAVHRGQPSQFGVGHRLRNEHRRHRHPSD